MIPALLGLPGKIKTLLDRLTSVRATALDDLDATISSRAPASTAMSNATWSDARAAKVDYLDVAVSTRLSTVINSIQQISYSSGAVAINAHTFTISAVTVAKTIVLGYCSEAVAGAWIVTNTTTIDWIGPSGLQACTLKAFVIELK